MIWVVLGLIVVTWLLGIRWLWGVFAWWGRHLAGYWVSSFGCSD